MSQDEWPEAPSSSFAPPSPRLQACSVRSGSSGGVSSISQFELDFDQLGGGWSLENKNVAVSEWLCTVISRHEQPQIPATQREPMLSSPGTAPLERTVSCSSRLSERAVRRVLTRSGTGFDGPLSSVNETPPLQPAWVRTVGDRVLMRNSPNSRDLNSERAGFLDWEKSWRKRKPRRTHEVSEVSDPDYSSVPRNTCPVYKAIRDMNLHFTKDSDKKSFDNSWDRISDAFTIHQSGHTSCPDINQRPQASVSSRLSRYGLIRGRNTQSLRHLKQYESQHQNRLLVSAKLSEGFRSLRHRLHRSRSSSTFSVRSDFGAPPDGKERRLLSRDLSRTSTDMWPSSGDESQIFNTPEPNVTPSQMGDYRSDPLAPADFTKAAAELDRLSMSLNRERNSRMSEPSLPGSHNTRGTTSPWNGSDMSTALEIVPNSPIDVSASSFTSLHLSCPVTRKVNRRRAQRSRLSEVTTPEDVGSPMQPVEESMADESYAQLTSSKPAPESVLRGIDGIVSLSVRSCPASQPTSPRDISIGEKPMDFPSEREIRVEKPTFGDTVLGRTDNKACNDCENEFWSPEMEELRPRLRHNFSCPTPDLVSVPLLSPLVEDSELACQEPFSRIANESGPNHIDLSSYHLDSDMGKHKKESGSQKGSPLSE
ncbi:hypothetical protein F5Y16DRAFT_173800 [Xylariaceae sp. FL0255]|nr:hypothetical protein F5Y16DRAFT_173800 [Xylariaceae sp. FL0255]